MKDPIPILLVGIVVSFGIGFLVGNSGRERVPEPPHPQNYDPVRSIVDDTIKNLQASQERCWSIFLDERRKELPH